MGWGEVCVALLLEICGPAAGTFCFTSQVSASCRRGLHQTPRARPLANSHFVQAHTALGQLSRCRFWTALGPVAGGGGGCPGLCGVSPQCATCSQHLPTSPTQDCVPKTVPHSVPVIIYF